MKSIEKFEKLYSKNKEELISIIGSGIIGLSTALILLDKGYKNIEIVAEEFQTTTSHRAGAYFGVFKISDEILKNPENEKIITDSYFTWKEIYNKKLFGITSGISYVDIFGGADNPVGPQESYIGIECLIEKQIIEDNQIVNISFNNNTSFKMKKNKTFYFNTTEILEKMYDTIETNNVKFIKKKIISIDDEKSLGNIVFNCTGVGSRELIGDKDIYPIAGHLILLNNQDIENINYVICCKYLLPEDSSTKDCKIFYYMPRNHNGITGILGGSYLEGYNGENQEINNKYYKTILRIAEHFFGIDLSINLK